VPLVFSCAIRHCITIMSRSPVTYASRVSASGVGAAGRKAEHRMEPTT